MNKKEKPKRQSKEQDFGAITPKSSAFGSTGKLVEPTNYPQGLISKTLTPGASFDTSQLNWLLNNLDQIAQSTLSEGLLKWREGIEYKVNSYVAYTIGAGAGQIFKCIQANTSSTNPDNSPTNIDFWIAYPGYNSSSHQFLSTDLAADHTISITHNLNTTDLSWSMYDPNKLACYPDIQMINDNTVKIDYNNTYQKLIPNGTYTLLLTGNSTINLPPIPDGVLKVNTLLPDSNGDVIVNADSIANQQTTATTYEIPTKSAVSQIATNKNDITLIKNTQTIPIGTTLLFFDILEENLPTDWFPRRGQVLDKATYPELWEWIKANVVVITTAQWAIDGNQGHFACDTPTLDTGSFTIPDDRGQFMRNTDLEGSRFLWEKNLTVGTIEKGAMLKHEHYIASTPTFVERGSPYNTGLTGTDTTSVMTGEAGTGQESRPSNVKVVSCIKVLNKTDTLNLNLKWGTTDLSDVGLIQAFPGELSKLPSDYLLCDGSTLDRSAYPELFEAIGVTYTPTPINPLKFNLPDLQGKAIMGVDSNNILADSQTDAFEAHNHISVPGSGSTSPTNYFPYGYKSGTAASSYSGSNTNVKYYGYTSTAGVGTVTQPKNTRMNWCIKYQASSSIPVATVIWSANKETPSGYLLCDGSNIPPQFTALITALGQTTTPKLCGATAKECQFIRSTLSSKSDVLATEDDAFLEHQHITSNSESAPHAPWGKAISTTSETLGGQAYSAMQLALGSKSVIEGSDDNIGGTETRPTNTKLIPYIKF